MMSDYLHCQCMAVICVDVNNLKEFTIVTSILRGHINTHSLTKPVVKYASDTTYSGHIHNLACDLIEPKWNWATLTQVEKNVR